MVLGHLAPCTHTPFLLFQLFYNSSIILQYLYVHCTTSSSLGLHCHTPHHPLPPTLLQTNPDFFLHFHNNFNSSFTSTLTPPRPDPLLRPDPPLLLCLHFHNNIRYLYTSTLTPPPPPPPPPTTAFFAFLQKLQFFFHINPDPRPGPTLFWHFHNNFSSFLPPPDPPPPATGPPLAFLFLQSLQFLVHNHPYPYPTDKRPLPTFIWYILQ